MAPKKFPPRKTATKGKRPPGVPAQVHPATTSDATSEVEASPAALHQEEETSFEGDATAATAATLADEEEEEEPLVMPDASHSPPHEEEEEEEQQQQPAPKTKGKGKKKADAAPKQGWSLPDTAEQDLVEWLQSNTYLWLRSTKDYHRKKASWEMKAKELGISLKHLQNWWKNVKDWYVKLSKRTSGQATKMLTERDKWVLKNIAFYKSSMPTDVPDTLVNLPRDPSPDAQTSQAQYPHDSGEANILEDMEVAAAAEQASTRRKRKTPATERQEEEWMVDLRSTMKANQALLERLLEERSQPQSRREAFIRFVSDTLRSAPEEEYQVMHDQIVYIVHRRHTGSSTSGAGPGPSTAPQPSRPSTSQQSAITPPTYSQQYFHMPGCPSPNWQYGGGQHPQQSPSLQPLTTLVRSRDSAESVGKVLGSSIAEDWNVSPYPPRLNDDLYIECFL
ncbi:hypothetical protein GWK47_037606 [Chionoecetes opilio]|uniref:MADF domain-containing protein n=1 Tax=Chionoecetes opilio TaxID=41210 RepID=A0A8J4YG78_CHIOP|nr:hypothetical protein GWK47_037606 [Chionoecetes opilio]